MKSLLILFVAILPLYANPDIFRERFADPATRAEAVAMLTPGTHDYFFHAALAHQLAGREKDYAEVITAWKAVADWKDSVDTARLEILEARRMLAVYDRDPKAALAEMIREMDLDFDHTRPDSVAEEKALPTSLDPKLITAGAFRKAVEMKNPEAPYTLYSQEVQYAMLNGLEKFSEESVRWFIRSFKHAHHPKYVALLAKGMSLKQPIGISAIDLDPLSLAQMDELRKAVPAVLSSLDFNVAYLSKLKPSRPKNLERHPEVHAAFLAKCRDYIVTLPPANNDLKAHVLYHHLRLQQMIGNHPKPDFIAYLALPRRSHGILRPTKESDHFTGGTDLLNAITQCPSVPSDAALIESYLAHFLALSDTPDKDLVPFIQEKRLATLHARARILAGADPALHAPRLGDDEYKSLREEVRIDFAPTVPQLFSAADNVSLPLDLKNAPTLLIRIYELQGKSASDQSGAAVDLDGLVPHHSRSVEYTQPPAVLHRENIALPELAGAGSWIVEFVAGRISARALVRKGNITPHITRTATGQEVRLFDESARAVADFRIELGSENFVSQGGVATVSNAPNQPLTTGTVTAGKLSGEIRLGSRTDELALKTAFLLDREQLLANQETTLHLRNQLTNHHQPLPLVKVKNATLTLKAKLLGGVVTERVIADPLELAETNAIPFLVPADLLSLTITLSGTVTPETSAEPVTLTQSETYDLNHALLTSRIGTLFFSPTEGGHRLELRGRNGEPLPNRPVSLSLVHRQYGAPVTVRLRTDDAGRIALGKLEDIETFTASSSSIVDTTFSPPIRSVEIPETYIIPANQPLRIPLVPDAMRTLVRLPDKTPMPYEITADGHLSVALDPASYQLRQGDLTTSITVFPADSVRAKWLVTADEIVPITNPATPTVASARLEGETLAIRTAGAAPETRVTVIAKRYHVQGWLSGLAAYPFEPVSPPLLTREIRPSAYLTDRRLSDEMRYILDRRAAKVFPGSMLPRPGQLLYRWTSEDIDQDEQAVRYETDGDESASMDGRGFDSIPACMNRRGDGNTAPNHRTTLDFLGFPAAVEFSLTPDAEGHVKIPLSRMVGAQFVEIIAADTMAADTVYLPLPASDTLLRDRRLARPLPPESHHIATRTAAALAPGAEAEIRNLLDADWRAFTTLEEAYQFLLGSSGSDDLRRFSFLTKWPTLDEKEKLRLLAAHHCHELHLFLARKDTDFFGKHVKPLLTAKPEPTFIDDYLLARDLSAYLRPFAFSRLNAAEKALLSQALPASRKAITSELGLRWQLEAPSPDAETVLFSQTLKGSDLSDTDSLGLAFHSRSVGSHSPMKRAFYGSGGTADSGIPVEGREVGNIVTNGIRSGDAAIRSSGIDAMMSSPSSGTDYLTEKLRRTIIPSIDFEDVTVEEAIDFLRMRSTELDAFELDPSKKGVSFVVRRPNTEQRGANDGNDPGALRIKRLQLKNVPVDVALKYVCDAANLRYRVDDYAVILAPLTDSREDLLTRIYRVSPDFLNSLSANENATEVDPFADSSGAGPNFLKARAPISELLKNAGINFPEGSTVTLSSSGQLLVTNTLSELDKIEQLTDSLGSGDDVDSFSSSGLNGLAPAPSAPRLFPDRTRLWLESNYYRNTDSTDEDLIPLNRFWLELASWDGHRPFTSPHFNACTESANEALMCLAVLDLPFTAEKPEVAVDGNTLKVKAVAPMLLFYKDTRETDNIAPESPLLVRQSYHPLDEPFRTVNGQRVENTHSGDFRIGSAYGVSLVITNPTGIERRIETLAQIPAGSIPLATRISVPKGNELDPSLLPPLDGSDPIGDDAPTTLSTAHDLEPYGVIQLQLAFYFPASGDYTAYPLHVSEDGTVLAHAQPRTLRVSAEPAPEDSASWEVLARDGTAEAVLSRLSTENLDTIDLDHILWRLRDRDFFLKATAILRQRLHMDEEIFNYALLHDDPASLSDLIESGDFSTSLGRWFTSKLVTITPAIHHGWETREFDPLVNARAHPFGENPHLSHPEAREHYHAFLNTLMWKPALSAADELTFTLFLFLQDRVGEALSRFGEIDPAVLPDRLQYDYLHAVTLFYQERPAEAKDIALPYSAKLPPGIWKDRYDAVVAQADELTRPIASVSTVEKDATPTLEITHKSDDWGMIVLKHSNLTSAEIRLYHIDLEILFSKDPFLKGGVESNLPPIAPNLTAKIPLNRDGVTLHTLPVEFSKGNVLIAAESGNVKKLTIMDSRAFEIRTNPSERTVQIIEPAGGKPLPKTYIKVYAESMDGSMDFHKDGYTDLRGKFDYLSHTATDPSTIRRLAILISHPEKGSRTTVIDR